MFCELITEFCNCSLWRYMKTRATITAPVSTPIQKRISGCVFESMESVIFGFGLKNIFENRC